MASMSQINRLTFILSLIGFAISGYLAFEYSQSGPIACPIGGTGCEIVRKSQFSKLFGIDLPYFGLAFYLTLASLSVFLVQSFTKSINIFRLVISFLGFVFGLYVTLLEAFIINAWCIWCVVSFIVSLIILILCMESVRGKLR